MDIIENLTPKKERLLFLQIEQYIFLWTVSLCM